MMYHNKLGFYLKQYRKAEKLTQDDLARILSVAKGTVSVWERDARLPETKMLIALSRMMKVPIDDVVGLKATESDAVNALDDVDDDNFLS